MMLQEDPLTGLVINGTNITQTKFSKAEHYLHTMYWALLTLTQVGHKDVVGGTEHRSEFEHFNGSTSRLWHGWPLMLCHTGFRS